MTAACPWALNAEVSLGHVTPLRGHFRALAEAFAVAPHRHLRCAGVNRSMGVVQWPSKVPCRAYLLRCGSRRALVPGMQGAMATAGLPVCGGGAAFQRHDGRDVLHRGHQAQRLPQGALLPHAGLSQGSSTCLWANQHCVGVHLERVLPERLLPEESAVAADWQHHECWASRAQVAACCGF